MNIKDKEELGVKAIIALQKLVGIDESEDIARANWKKFSEAEKEQTLFFYNLCCKS